jgi:hypothetical protein
MPQFIALSSGEAEFFAALEGCNLGSGMKSVAAELAIQLKIKLCTDRAAAKGIMLRRGLGKLRHIEVGYLCLQDAVAEKRLSVHKRRGEDNPADLGAKHAIVDVIQRRLATLG